MKVINLLFPIVMISCDVSGDKSTKNQRNTINENLKDIVKKVYQHTIASYGVMYAFHDTLVPYNNRTQLNHYESWNYEFRNFNNIYFEKLDQALLKDIYKFGGDDKKQLFTEGYIPNMSIKEYYGIKTVDSIDTIYQLMKNVITKDKEYYEYVHAKLNDKKNIINITEKIGNNTKAVLNYFESQIQFLKFVEQQINSLCPRQAIPCFFSFYKQILENRYENEYRKYTKVSGGLDFIDLLIR